MAYERRIKITHSIADAYKFYRNIYKGKLTKKQYTQVAYEINRKISTLIIKESFEYKIPHGLGFLRIKKRKLRFKLNDKGKIDINKNIIDWKATWDYWEREYPGLTRKQIKDIPGKKVFFQTNEHTDGEVMSWYWDKRTSKIKNIILYSFRTVKGGSEEDTFTGRLGLRDWINARERKNEYYY